MPSPPLPADAAAWQVVVLVVVTAVPVLLGTRALLRRLPEPAEPDGKTAYRDLASARFVGVCTGTAAAGAVLVGLALPPPTWPLWWVLAAPGAVLAAIDARTTWLPLPLTRVAWGAGVVGAAFLLGLGGPVPLGRAAVGATATGLFFYAFWRLSRGGIGYGDVRLAPLLGGAAAAVGWSTLLATLLLGSLVGAAVGLVLLARRRPGAFAYAPSMLAGAFLACASRLVSG